MRKRFYDGMNTAAMQGTGCAGQVVDLARSGEHVPTLAEVEIGHDTKRDSRRRARLRKQCPR